VDKWYDAASALDLSEERDECEGWGEMERESQVSVFVLLYCFTVGVSICTFLPLYCRCQYLYFCTGKKQCKSTNTDT
jgi:hypothetical protein